MSQYLVKYRCPKCSETWEEVWASPCDSECPKCGTRDIEAYEYDHIPYD